MSICYGSRLIFTQVRYFFVILLLNVRNGQFLGLMQQLPVHLRGEAADTLYYEAQCRIENPVYGCVGIITQLHEEINNANKELAIAQAQVAVHHHRSQNAQEAVVGEGAIVHDNQVGTAGAEAEAILGSDQNEFDMAALMSPPDSNWFY